MATKGKNQVAANIAPRDLVDTITRSIGNLASNHGVVAFDIKVNKKSGLVRLNAKQSNGRTTTKTLLGPGLENTLTYDPSQNTKHDRDQNIRHLLALGMTQAEAAENMGISQALVSKVHRAK